jgi:formate-dependent nitrite reductase membrane component NrfD
LHCAERRFSFDFLVNLPFLEVLTHPQTSWLSRGLFFVFLFGAFGFFQMLFQYFIPAQTTLILVFKIIAGIFALCVATYTGFVLNNVKGVPFWELPILPLLFVACGILGGFGLTVAIGLFSEAINMEAAEMGSRIMLLVNVLLIFIYGYGDRKR